MLLTRLRRLAIPVLLCLLLPSVTHAICEAGIGGEWVAQCAIDIRNAFMPLWVSVGVLVLVIAGFALIIAQDEGALSKAKTAITGVVAGGIFIMITPELFKALYSGQLGEVVLTAPGEFALQSVGLVAWASSMAAMVGVLVVIISVLRAVASFGDENAYSTARMSLLYAILGILIIAGSAVITDTFFAPVAGAPSQPGLLLAYIMSKVEILLAVITTVAVAIIVYAGIRMIANFGNEEAFNSAKGLIIRAVIGLVVILFSFVMVGFVVTLF